MTGKTVGDAGTSLQIGWDAAGQCPDAWIDDLRVSKGVARYVIDFTPPTHAFDTSMFASYWDLDEASGARADAKGTTTLTDYNTTGVRPGKNAYAADFVAVNSEFLSAAGGAIKPTCGYAVSFWMYPDMNTFGLAPFVFFSSSASSGLRVVAPTASSSLDFAFYQSDGTLVTTPSGTVVNNVWTHVVVIADAFNHIAELYINGAQQGSDTSYDGTIMPPTTSLAIGNGAGAQSDGGIDEMAVWRDIRFTDAAERQAFVDYLYNSGAGRFYP